jgi:hypothetical protein
MTSFAEIIAGDDLDVVFNADEHAQAVTYNGTPISAVLTFGDIMDDDVAAITRQKVLWVKASDVSTPAYRDTVVTGSETWRVGPEDKHESDGSTWKLPLFRDERPIL